MLCWHSSALSKELYLPTHHIMTFLCPNSFQRRGSNLSPRTWQASILPRSEDCIYWHIWKIFVFLEDGSPGTPLWTRHSGSTKSTKAICAFFLYAEGRWGVPLHSIQLKTWLVINIYAKRLQKHKIARRDGVRPWSQHLGDWGKGISTFRPAWLRTICKEHKHEQQTKQTIIRSVVSSASMT